MPKYEVRRCENPSEKWGVFSDYTQIGTFDTEDAAMAELNRLETWLRELSKKQGKEPCILVEGMNCVGSVIDRIDGAWAQKTNRDGSWVVHHSNNPPQVGQSVTVKFKSGKSEIDTQGKLQETGNKER